ncbi:unnamed protein product, partial [Owenia fusiformis]
MSGKQFLYLFLTVCILILASLYFYQAKIPKQGTLILGQTSGRSLHEVYVRGLGDGIHEPPSSNSPMGRYENAAIATDHAKCSKIGKDMMYNGGSAVDAAIAAMLCIGVLHSQSAGIGGGSLATIYDTKKRDVLTLDCREEAPSISNTHMFVQNMDASLTGGLAIGVPSQVAICYKKMHELYGTLPWKALFQPTIEICREGFKIGQAMGAGLERQTRESLNPGMKIFINPDTDEPYQEGDYMRMPDLADTLELIAEKGAQEFYHGDLARSVVNEIQEAGGRIILKDLRSYNVLVKRALNLTLANGNYTVLCPPPPSGGATLLYVLNILDGYNFSADSLATTQKSVLTYHRIIEAFKFAFAKRSLLGDERFTNTDEIVKLMMSKDYAAHIRDIITDEETHDYNYYGAEYDNVENHGTSHLSILGPDGIAVSLTSTINTFYGSKVLGTKTGILYNNNMDDFAT